MPEGQPILTYKQAIAEPGNHARARVKKNVSESKSKDLRRYARFEVLDYAKVDGGTKSEPISAVVVDVGLGGIQIRCRETIKAGTKVNLVIGSESGDSISLSAEVVSCRAIEDSDLNGVGCRFLPNNHEERIVIAEYVHTVFQRQGEKLVS